MPLYLACSCMFYVEQLKKNVNVLLKQPILATAIVVKGKQLLKCANNKVCT